MVLGYVALMSGLGVGLACVSCDCTQRLAIAIPLFLCVGWVGSRQVFRDTTVKAVTLYFICLTTVMTLALWLSESDRIVQNKRPVIRETAIVVKEDSGEMKELRREMHTYTEDIEYRGERFLDCWFTIVSAACVTGLIVTDTAAMTGVGQVIILITIQAGGLGIIFFTSFIGFLVTRGESTRSHFDHLHAEALDVEERFVGRMLQQVLQYTVVIEGTAILILGSYYQWMADPTPLKGINPWWWASFHAISAFNNAGFSIMSDNLCGFVTDVVVNLTIASLIILGGLGYPVLIRLWVWLRVSLGGRNGKTTRLIEQLEVVQASRLQTQIALQGTVMLIKLGTVLPLIFDWNNPLMEKYAFYERVLICFFQSVSARTAGFNTIDLGQLSVASALVIIILMYIGTCPAGTGGGIKIPTVWLLFAYIWNWFREPFRHVVIRDWSGQDRMVHRDTMSAAIRLFFSSLLVLGVSTMLICIFEARFLSTPDPTFNYLNVVFEVVSGYGTVGDSRGFEGGVTSFAGIMTDDSKIVLNLTMLIGRIGPLTLLALIPWRKDFGAIDLLPENIKKVQIG